MARGARENVRALMRERQHLLRADGGEGHDRIAVLDGQAGEAEALLPHELVLLAAALVGLTGAAGKDEHGLDILIDESNPVYAQLADLVKKLTGWPMQPLVHGVGPTILPHPERLYFWFGEPIDTTRFAGRHDDEAARAVRDEVKRAVEGGIDFLLAEREADPQRGLGARLLGRGSTPS